MKSMELKLTVFLDTPAADSCRESTKHKPTTVNYHHRIRFQSGNNRKIWDKSHIIAVYFYGNNRKIWDKSHIIAVYFYYTWELYRILRRNLVESERLLFPKNIIRIIQKSQIPLNKFTIRLLLNKVM